MNRLIGFSLCGEIKRPATLMQRACTCVNNYNLLQLATGAHLAVFLHSFVSGQGLQQHDVAFALVFFLPLSFANTLVPDISDNAKSPINNFFILFNFECY